MDNLLGATVRIRRGRHGGRTGKVIVCDRQQGFTSTYSVIKVQLDASGQIVNLNSVEELEKLTNPPSIPAIPSQGQRS